MKLLIKVFLIKEKETMWQSKWIDVFCFLLKNILKIIMGGELSKISTFAKIAYVQKLILHIIYSIKTIYLIV